MRDHEAMPRQVALVVLGDARKIDKWLKLGAIRGVTVLRITHHLGEDLEVVASAELDELRKCARDSRSHICLVTSRLEKRKEQIRTLERRIRDLEVKRL